MKKTFRKRYIVLPLIVLLFLVVLLVAAFRIPTRITAGQMCQDISLPYALLDRKPDFSSEQYGVIGGFGITGYYDLAYGEPDAYGNQDFDAVAHQAVVYYTSMWPDTVFGKSRITRIDIADPAVDVFGCHVGDAEYMLIQAMKDNGFREKSRHVYQHNGIRISYELDEENRKLTKVTLSVQSTNICGVQYKS